MENRTGDSFSLGFPAAGRQSDFTSTTSAASCRLRSSGFPPSNYRSKHLSPTQTCSLSASFSLATRVSSSASSSSSFSSASLSPSPPSLSPSAGCCRPSRSSASISSSSPASPFSDEEKAGSVSRILLTLCQRRFSFAAFRQASARLSTALRLSPVTQSDTVEDGSTPPSASFGRSAAAQHHPHVDLQSSPLPRRFPCMQQRDVTTASGLSLHLQNLPPFSPPERQESHVAAAPCCSVELSWLAWRLLHALAAALSRNYSLSGGAGTCAGGGKYQDSHCCSSSSGGMQSAGLCYDCWGSCERRCCCRDAAAAEAAQGEKSVSSRVLWQVLLGSDKSRVPPAWAASHYGPSAAAVEEEETEEGEGKMGEKEEKGEQRDAAPSEENACGVEETSDAADLAGAPVSRETETAEWAGGWDEATAATAAAVTDTDTAAAAPAGDAQATSPSQKWKSPAANCGSKETRAAAGDSGTEAPDAGRAAEQAAQTGTPADACKRFRQGAAAGEIARASLWTASHTPPAAVEGVGSNQSRALQPVPAADATEEAAADVTEGTEGISESRSRKVSSSSSSSSRDSDTLGSSRRSRFEGRGDRCRGSNGNTGRKHCSRCINSRCTHRPLTHADSSTGFHRDSPHCCNSYLLHVCRAFNMFFCAHFCVSISSREDPDSVDREQLAAAAAAPPPPSPAAAGAALAETGLPCPSLYSSAAASSPCCCNGWGSLGLSATAGTSADASGVPAVVTRAQDFLLPLLLQQSRHLLLPTAMPSLTRSASLSHLHSPVGAACMSDADLTPNEVAHAAVPAVLPAALHCFALLLRGCPAAAVLLAPSLLQLLRTASAALLASPASLFAQQTPVNTTATCGARTLQTEGDKQPVSQKRVVSSSWGRCTGAGGPEVAEQQHGQTATSATAAADSASGAAAAPCTVAADPVAAATAARPTAAAPAAATEVKAAGAAGLLTATATLLRELLPISLDMVFAVACAALSASDLCTAEKSSPHFSYTAKCAAASSLQRAGAVSSNCGESSCCRLSSPRIAADADVPPLRCAAGAPAAAAYNAFSGCCACCCWCCCCCNTASLPLLPLATASSPRDACAAARGSTHVSPTGNAGEETETPDSSTARDAAAAPSVASQRDACDRETAAAEERGVDIAHCASQLLQQLLLLYSCCVQTVLLLLLFLRPSSEDACLDYQWLDAHAAAAAQWGSASVNIEGSSSSNRSTWSNIEDDRCTETQQQQQHVRDFARRVLASFSLSVRAAKQRHYIRCQQDMIEDPRQKQQQHQEAQQQQQQLLHQQDQQQQEQRDQQQQDHQQEQQEEANWPTQEMDLQRLPQQEEEAVGRRENGWQTYERETVDHLFGQQQQQQRMQTTSSRLFQLDQLLLGAATTGVQTSSIHSSASNSNSSWSRNSSNSNGASNGERSGSNSSTRKSSTRASSSWTREVAPCISQPPLGSGRAAGMHGVTMAPQQQQLEHVHAGAQKKCQDASLLRLQQQQVVVIVEEDQPRKPHEAQAVLARLLQSIAADAQRQLLHAMGGALLLLGRGRRELIEKQPVILNTVWRLLLQLLLPHAKKCPPSDFLRLPTHEQQVQQQEQQLQQQQQQQREDQVQQQQQHNFERQGGPEKVLSRSGSRGKRESRMQLLKLLQVAASKNNHSDCCSTSVGLAAEWLLAALLQLAALHLGSLLCNTRAAAFAGGRRSDPAAAEEAAAPEAARDVGSAALATVVGDAKVAVAGRTAAAADKPPLLKEGVSDFSAAKEIGRWSPAGKQQLQRLLLQLSAATKSAMLFQFYAAKVGRLLQRLPSPLGLWEEEGLPQFLLRRCCCCCHCLSSSSSSSSSSSRRYHLRQVEQCPQLSLHAAKLQQQEQQHQQEKTVQGLPLSVAEASNCFSGTAAAAASAPASAAARPRSTCVDGAIVTAAASAASDCGICNRVQQCSSSCSNKQEHQQRRISAADTQAPPPQEEKKQMHACETIFADNPQVADLQLQQQQLAQRERGALQTWLFSVFLYQQQSYSAAAAAIAVAAARDAAREAAAAGAEELLLQWRELELLFLSLRERKRTAEVVPASEKSSMQQQVQKQQVSQTPVGTSVFSAQQHLLQQGLPPQQWPPADLSRPWRQQQQHQQNQRVPQQQRDQRRQAEHLLQQQQQQVESQVQQVCMRARGLAVLLAGRSSSHDLAVIQRIVEKRHTAAAATCICGSITAAGAAQGVREGGRGYPGSSCTAAIPSSSLHRLPAADPQPLSEWLFLSAVLCSLPDFFAAAAAAPASAATKERKKQPWSSAADDAAAATDHQKPGSSFAAADGAAAAVLPGTREGLATQSATTIAMAAAAAASSSGGEWGSSRLPLAAAESGGSAPVASAAAEAFSEAAAAAAASVWRPAPYAAAEAATRAFVALQQWLCKYPFACVYGSLLQGPQAELQQPQQRQNLMKTQRPQQQQFSHQHGVREKIRQSTKGQHVRQQSKLLLLQEQQQEQQQQQQLNCQHQNQTASCWPQGFVARWVLHAVADMRAMALLEQQATGQRRSRNSSSGADSSCSSTSTDSSSSSNSNSTRGQRENDSTSSSPKEAERRQLRAHHQRALLLLLQRFFYWSSSCHPPLHSLALRTWGMLMSDGYCGSNIGARSSCSSGESSSVSRSVSCGAARGRVEYFLRAAKVDLLSCLLSLATWGSASHSWSSSSSRGNSRGLRPQQPQQQQECEKQTKGPAGVQQQQRLLPRSNTCEQQLRVQQQQLPLLKHQQEQQQQLQQQSLQHQQQAVEDMQQGQLQQQGVVGCGRGEMMRESSGYERQKDQQVLQSKHCCNSRSRNTTASSSDGSTTALQQELLLLPSVEQQQLLECVYVALQAAPHWLQQHVLEQQILPFCEVTVQRLQQLSSAAAAADHVADTPPADVATASSSFSTPRAVAAAAWATACKPNPPLRSPAAASAAPAAVLQKILSASVEAQLLPLCHVRRMPPNAGRATVLLLVELLQHLPSSIFQPPNGWGRCSRGPKEQQLPNSHCVAAAAIACGDALSSSAGDHQQHERRPAGAVGCFPAAAEYSSSNSNSSSSSKQKGIHACWAADSNGNRGSTAAACPSCTSNSIIEDRGRVDSGVNKGLPGSRISRALSDCDSSTGAARSGADMHCKRLSNGCNRSSNSSVGGSGRGCVDSSNIGRTELNHNRLRQKWMVQRTVASSERLEACVHALLEELLQMAFACASQASAASAAAAVSSTAAAAADGHLQQVTCLQAYIDNELVAVELICRVCCCCWDGPFAVASAISRHAPELCCFLRQYLCSPKVAAVADHLDAAAAATALATAATAAPSPPPPANEASLSPTVPSAADGPSVAGASSCGGARRTAGDEAAGCGLLYAAALAVCCCSYSFAAGTRAAETAETTSQEQIDSGEIEVLLRVLLQTLHNMLAARPHFISWALSKSLCFLQAAAVPLLVAAHQAGTVEQPAALPTARAAATCSTGGQQSHRTASEVAAAAGGGGVRGGAAFDMMRRVCCATRDALLLLETQLPPAVARTLWHCAAAVDLPMGHWRDTKRTGSSFCNGGGRDTTSNTNCSRRISGNSTVSHCCIMNKDQAAQNKSFYDLTSPVATQAQASEPHHLEPPQREMAFTIAAAARPRPASENHARHSSRAAPAGELRQAPAAVRGAKCSLAAASMLEPLAARENKISRLAAVDEAVRWCEAALQRGMLGATTCEVLRSSHKSSSEQFMRGMAGPIGAGQRMATKDVIQQVDSRLLTTAGEARRKLLRAAALVEPASPAAAVEIRDCVAALFSELRLPAVG